MNFNFNYNYKIECRSVSDTVKVRDKIKALHIYQDSFEMHDTTITLVSKQALLKELRMFSFIEKIDMHIKVWSEHLEYEDVVDLEWLDQYTYVWSEQC